MSWIIIGFKIAIGLALAWLTIWLVLLAISVVVAGIMKLFGRY